MPAFNKYIQSHHLGGLPSSLLVLGFCVFDSDRWKNVHFYFGSQCNRKCVYVVRNLHYAIFKLSNVYYTMKRCTITVYINPNILGTAFGGIC